eukprot:CAMPEP_0194110982 /NCGR_PEP_ID=MMETSP0150-20130528/10091_1 /TAXON_ID=122233 /ORGANISM="Chaetoceros debilis, Strain MM31A-1" /LENGTH=1306 /DNA_ID=CAMNT_0038800289 /DNA_START=328 /DNA_END=4248 /DNA_ORIENTATION=+
MVDTPFKIRVIVDGEAVRIPEGADAQSEVPVGNEGREGEKQIQIEKNDDVAMKEKKNQDLESDENIEKNEGESQTKTRIDSPFKLQLTVIVNGVTQSLDANDEIEEVQVGKKINGKKDNITTENNESQEKDNDVGVGVPSGVRSKPKKAKSASAAKTAVPASKKKKAIKKRKGRGKSLPPQNIETNDTQETDTAVKVGSRPRRKRKIVSYANMIDIEDFQDSEEEEPAKYLPVQIKDEEIYEEKKTTKKNRGRETSTCVQIPLEEVSKEKKTTKKKGGKKTSTCVQIPVEEVSEEIKATKKKLGREKPLCAQVPVEEILPLPPCSALPTTFPNTGHCKWTYDSKTRVLLAQISQDGGKGIHPDDEDFLMRMMERTDIAVVSEGILCGDSPLLELQYIKDRAGANPHHRFREFTMNGVSQEEIDAQRIGKSKKDEDPKKQQFAHSVENNGDMSLQISEYVDYLEEYKNILKGNVSFEDEVRGFQFSNMPERTFDPRRDYLYLLDMDLKRTLPESHNDFLKNFRLPKCLPGGDFCMMNSVNDLGRPFMGPNLYVTPPGSFTHFHQDGHGTVDSGHMCIDGYNEVIMLRRMSEDHKRQALHLLHYNDRRQKNIHYDALYGLPHHDGKKPLWPDHEAIKNCDELNYYPCVFILKPGQFLHINKGRLHAFRKAGRNPVDPKDCHSDIREECMANGAIKPGSICKSIAWDWMYTGTTEKGIHEEVSYALSCARLAKKHGVQSLAIPESCIIQMANHHIAQHKILSNFPLQSKPSDLTFLKGIFPTLKGILQDQISEIHEKTEISKTDPFVEVVFLPDAKKDPQKVTIDPFGNDFFCKICQQELSNIYMHCEGCESLLQKDFNICTGCHGNDETRLKNITMHPNRPLNGSNAGRRADYNHMPATRYDRKGGCGCKNGPVCRQCRFMICCSCKCHKKYSLRMRFRDVNEIESLLKDAERYVENLAIDTSGEAGGKGTNATSADDTAATTSITAVTHGDKELQEINSTRVSRRKEGPIAKVNACVENQTEKEMRVTIEQLQQQMRDAENKRRTEILEHERNMNLLQKEIITIRENMHNRDTPEQVVQRTEVTTEAVNLNTSGQLGQWEEANVENNNSNGEDNDSRDKGIERFSSTTLPPKKRLRLNPQQPIDKAATSNEILQEAARSPIARDESSNENTPEKRCDTTSASSGAMDVPSPNVCKSTTPDDGDLSMNGLSNNRIAEDHTRGMPINTSRISPRMPISMVMDEIHYASSGTVDDPSPTVCRSATPDHVMINGMSEKEITEEHTREEEINTLHGSRRSMVIACQLRKTPT